MVGELQRPWRRDGLVHADGSWAHDARAQRARPLQHAPANPAPHAVADTEANAESYAADAVAHTMAHAATDTGTHVATNASAHGLADAADARALARALTSSVGALSDGCAVLVAARKRP